jgi:hypothetical protein
MCQQQRQSCLPDACRDRSGWPSRYLSGQGFWFMAVTSNVAVRGALTLKCAQEVAGQGHQRQAASPPARAMAGASDTPAARPPALAGWLAGWLASCEWRNAYGRERPRPVEIAHPPPPARSLCHVEMTPPRVAVGSFREIRPSEHLVASPVQSGCTRPCIVFFRVRRERGRIPRSGACGGRTTGAGPGWYPLCAAVGSLLARSGGAL